MIAETSASETFISLPGSLNVVTVSVQPGDLIDRFLETGTFVVQRKPFREVGADFRSGTNAGVGRISLAGKGALYSGERLRLAVAPELLLPSPSENEFAGTASTALGARAIATFDLAAPVRLHADAGYEYDFSYAQLSRFVWTTGVSIPLTAMSFDLGLGGSEFNEGITWTPDTSAFVASDGRPGTIWALGDNQLGQTFVDFLGGIKVRLGEHAVLAGAVDVPVVDEGFRPAVVGTVAVELYM